MNGYYGWFESLFHRRVKLKLEALLEQSRTNHYKTLIIVDNNQKHERIINALKDWGWSAFDVNRSVLEILEDLPEAKVKLRIGDALKRWFNSLPDKVILYNTAILYSPELGKLNPVGAFKYKSRTKEVILILEGRVSGDRIQYSDYGKEDYCEMDVSELIHAKMEDIDV